MAISMAPPEAPQCRIVESEHIKNPSPADLAQAIFLPFAALRSVPLSSSTPISQTQKLQRIVENVKHQQGLVRGNLENVVLDLARRLKDEAERELLATGEETADWVIEDTTKIVEARNEKRREAAALMKFMQRPAKEGATADHFTSIVRERQTTRDAESYGILSRKRHASGDFMIIDTDMDTELRLRHPLTIRTEVSANLRSLITNGTEQLEAYDKLCLTTLDRHKQELARHTFRGGMSFPPVVVRSGLESLSITPHGMTTERHDSNFNTSSRSSMKGSPALEDSITTPQRASSLRRESRHDGSNPSPKRVRFGPSVEITNPTPKRAGSPSPVKSRSRSGSGSGSGNVSRTPQRATTLPGVLFNDEKIPNTVADGELRRTSTGMPIAGSAASEPIRNMRTLEELARR